MDTFWEQKILWRNNGDITPTGAKCARIDGAHYIIEPERANCNHNICFCGFGGHEFVIEFTQGPHRGEIIKTTNLWHQGFIPNEYRNQLPDNAYWVDRNRQWKQHNEIFSLSEG